MPRFGRKSRDVLMTLHDDLKLVCVRAIEIIDFALLSGHRGRDEQNSLFLDKKSHLQFPDSKHNKMPSDALDFAPFPINWDDISRFYRVIGVLQGIAKEHDIKLEFGADWKTFKDYGHVQRSTK